MGAIDPRAPEPFNPDAHAASRVAELERRLSALERGGLVIGATRLHVADPVTSGPTTPSVAEPMTAVMPEMSVTADFGGNPVLAMHWSTLQLNTVAASSRVALYDGATELTRNSVTWTTAGNSMPSFLFWAYTPAPGPRTIEARWNVTSGILTAVLLRRQFVVVEFLR